MAYDTQFASMLALARLPWFDINDTGRLIVSDPEVGEIVDVHTHLSIRYGSRQRLLPCSGCGPTRHYLPLEREVDLSRYANQNLTAPDLAAMRRSLGVGSVTGLGMQQSHNVTNLTAEMAELGVSNSVLLPIELPLLSWNTESYLEVAASREELATMASVHPLNRNLGGRLEAYQGRGACGVKIHPGVQMVRPDSKRAMAIYRVCADLKLPVLWHCGPVGIEPRWGRRCSQLEYYWNAVKANPDTTFILGHSGALQFDSGLELCCSFPNVWLEISCQGVEKVSDVVSKAPPERIMFGSDWPFYHQALPLAKVLIATEGQPASRRRLLSENAHRLFGSALATASPAGFVDPEPRGRIGV